MSLRVLIVAADPEARRGLSHVLAGEAGVAVVDAGDCEKTLHEVRAQCPDIVVLDGIPPPGVSNTVRTILAEAPAAKTLLVSDGEDPEEVREAFDAGVSGYLLKGAAAPKTLLGAVRVLAPVREATEPQLTARQREVLRLLALGHTNHEIARELFLSVRTVETHRAHLMQKLKLSNRAELVRYALGRGLLDG